MRKVILLVAWLLLLTRPVLAQPALEGPIYLLGEMSDVERITFTSAIATKQPKAIILAHSPRTLEPNRHFLKLAKAEKIQPIGKFADLAEVKKRYGLKFAKVQTWNPGPGPNRLREQLWPTARSVVLCSSGSRPQLFQLAVLAGGTESPLLVVDTFEQLYALSPLLEKWQTRSVVAMGQQFQPPFLPTGVQRGIINLASEQELALHLAWSEKPVRHLVGVNPDPARSANRTLSSLAPMLAIQRGGRLLLTPREGHLEPAARKLLPAAPALESLLLLGDLQAIPPSRRPNPTPQGRDAHVETEPTTPTDKSPVSLAVGRLFHEDYGIVLLALARQKLLQRTGVTRPKALVVSNPGDSLPLLETISRHTAAELVNSGYHTTALFGDNASRERVRQLLPEQSLFLWEGHHSTLVREYGIPRWKEPLQPSLIFLQSCLALTEEKAHPFLERGACAVIGSSARNYSASGGAFALAFTNALLYERQPAGAALRQAKNFLLCFSLLKQERLEGGSKLAGANLRSAWGFTLWGDPLLQLPAPVQKPVHQPVRHEVTEDRLLVRLPEQKHPLLGVGDYQARIWPNARLAGLFRKDLANDSNSPRELVPLVFLEFQAKPARKGARPRLQSRLPAANWVLSWDERRCCGYLLIRPRSRDTGTLRFDIAWEG